MKRKIIVVAVAAVLSVSGRFGGIIWAWFLICIRKIS